MTELAKVYVQVAEDLLKGITHTKRPSGWISSVKDLGETVNQEVLVKRLGWQPCELGLGDGQANSNFLHNDLEQKAETDWEFFWDEYANWLKDVDIQELWPL